MIKLHTKLGKPIPSVDPVIVSANKSNNSNAEECNALKNKNNVPKINIVSMAKANDKATANKTSNGQTEASSYFFF